MSKIFIHTKQGTAHSFENYGLGRDELVSQFQNYNWAGVYVSNDPVNNNSIIIPLDNVAWIEIQGDSNAKS